MSTWEYHDLQSQVDDKPESQPNWPVFAGMAFCAGFWLVVGTLVGVI